MKAATGYLVRVAHWCFVLLLAAIAGWMFARSRGGDHQLFAAATSIFAVLAALTSVTPGRSSHTTLSPATGDSALAPPAGPVVGEAAKPSHIHIPRRRY